jgi:hypothetical protein
MFMIEPANSIGFIIWRFRTLKPEGTVRDIYIFLKLAPDVLAKAYPTIPLLANSKLVTQFL